MDNQPQEIESQDTENLWWRSQLRWAVYNAFKEGKGVLEIAKELDSKPYYIEEIVASPFFIKKLEHYLAAQLFGYQVKTLVTIEKLFDSLWNRVKGSFDELKPEAALTALLKLMPNNADLKKPTLINPKQFNTIINLLDQKTSAEVKTNLINKAKEFGYHGLDEDEGSDEHFKLDPGSESPNE
jgi:hypothetical protein